MKNALEINMVGLKCDNPTCDYVDMSIDAKDYEKWVNVKCPKYGEILLTEADYNNTKFLLGIVDLGNKIFPKRRDDEKYATMIVEMDGSGDMNHAQDINMEALECYKFDCTKCGESVILTYNAPFLKESKKSVQPIKL